MESALKEKYLFTLKPELELRGSKLLLEIATVDGIYISYMCSYHLW
jgi:hypothetical protein